MTTHQISLNASSERPAEWPAFFRHHGFVAPGIRAFRRIGFPAKSARVSLAFLFPIILLSASQWLTASANIEFSSKERLGVAYARALMPLLDAALNRRRSATANAPDLQDAQQRVAKAFEAAAAANTLHAKELQVSDAWSKVKRLHQDLSAQPVMSDRSATFDAHSAYVEAIFDLLRDVADALNLTLDPDVDTFYLMDAGIVRQSLLIEQLGRVRGMGNAIITSGQKSKQQRDLITNALAFSLTYKDSEVTALKRATAADSFLKDELKEEEVFKST